MAYLTEYFGRAEPIRAPDKIAGTHVSLYIKYINNAFSKKARKREVERSTQTNQVKQFKIYKTMKNEQIKIHKAEFPFQVVESNKKFHITIGNQVMSQKTFDKLADARQYILQKPYELIINAACFAMSLNVEQSKTDANNEKDNKKNT